MSMWNTAWKRGEPVTETSLVCTDILPLFRKENNPDIVADRWDRLREDVGCLLGQVLDKRTWAVSFHEETHLEVAYQSERLKLTVNFALLDWRQAEVGEWVHEIRDAREFPVVVLPMIVPATAEDIGLGIDVNYKHENRHFERVGRYWRRTR